MLAVGFENLTVAAVAGHLGVAAGGLYNYVDDRDDLVIAAVDHLFASMPRDCPDDWRAFLLGEAWSRWDAIVAHPGIIRALRATGRTAVEPRRRFAWMVDELTARGLDAADALLAVDSIIDLVSDGAQQYEALQRRSSEDAAPFVPDDAAASARLHDAMRLVRADPRSFFARKLDVVIAGLEVVIGTEGPGREQL